MKLSSIATIVLLLATAFAGMVQAAPGSEAAVALAKAFPQFKWQTDTAITIDIGADGLMDTAVLGYTEKTAAVGIVFHQSPKGMKPQFVDFMRGRDSQSGICGQTAKLTVNKHSTAPKEALGDFPEGYRICHNCFEVVVTSNVECDPMTIYWNRKRRQLDWWRA